jgi:hypothetical protein
MTRLTWSATVGVIAGVAGAIAISIPAVASLESQAAVTHLRLRA